MVNPLENFSQEHVVKLHDAASPQELGIGSYKGKLVRVNTSTMEHLKLAQETLRKTKMILPYGASNQISDIVHTEGASLARGIMKNTLVPPSPTPSPYANAKVAAHFQAGGSREHADVAYTLLAQKRINAPVLEVRDNNRDHDYVLIGDPRDQTWGEKNTVVVDPWVRYPSAVTLKQAKNHNPDSQPIHQRERNAAPVPDAHRLNSIKHVTKKELYDFSFDTSLPLIGPEYLRELAVDDEFESIPDEKTVAKDPSTRYTSNFINAKSMDKIAQATVLRQRAAQQAMESSPYVAPVLRERAAQ